MKPEKDIGEFIKSKIDETRIAPDKQVWEKIDASLEKRTKKKKLFYLLLFLIGIPLMGALWFYSPFDNLSKQPPSNQENNVNNKFEGQKNDLIRNNSSADSFRIEKINNSAHESSITKSSDVKSPMKVSGENNKRKAPIASKERKHQDLAISASKPKSSKSSSTAKEKSEKTKTVQPHISAPSTLAKEKENTENFFTHEKDSTEVPMDSLSIYQNKISDLSRAKKDNKDSLNVNKSKQKLWGIGIITAGEYFGSSSDGSMIDPRLDGKKTEGEFHFQYGLSLHMKLSPRFEISYGASMTTYRYKSYLDHPHEALNLSAIDLSTFTELETFIDNTNSIYLAQRISYVELPLQLSYRITNKKLGIEGLVGISTLILRQNKVELIGENITSLDLGSANNLSKLNFSINAGLGGYYQVSDQLKFGLMPMIKYHFKPLSKDNYNRRTNYSLGLHATLTYYFDF